MSRAHATSRIIIAALFAGACVPTVQAQCTTLLGDLFQLGPRPHGGNGDPRDAAIHDGLNGYWPMQGPPGVKWRTPDNQTTGWSFAASSVDLLEPLEDMIFSSNGTVVGEGHAAALLDFTPPAEPFTLSVDVSPIQTLADGVYVGFTSSGALADNFAAFGAIWVSVDGFGQWDLWANGTTEHLASGVAGPLWGWTGWIPVVITFDPGTLGVTGSVAGTPFGPITLSQPPTINFAGMEAHNIITTFQVANNFQVRTGGGPTVSIPLGGGFRCPGSIAFFVATTNAAGTPRIVWRWRGMPLSDGVLPGVGIVAGANSTALSISILEAGAIGTIDCVVASECGVAISPSLPLVVGLAGDADRNGMVNFADVTSVLSTWGMDYSPNSGTGDADYDGDVDFADITAVLARWGRLCLGAAAEAPGGS